MPLKKEDLRNKQSKTMPFEVLTTHRPNDIGEYEAIIRINSQSAKVVLPTY